jgi:hypothetical protein
MRVQSVLSQSKERPQPLGRAERTREYVITAKGRPACRAYSAEVASATKAGSSGAGTAVFFNRRFTLRRKESHGAWLLADGDSIKRGRMEMGT